MRHTLRFLALCAAIAVCAALLLSLSPSSGFTAAIGAENGLSEGDYAREDEMCGPLRATPPDVLMELYIEAFILVESGGDDGAVGTCDDVGCLQITPVVVEDCNRILGVEHFSLEDRYDRERSKEMFRIIQGHYNDAVSLPAAARRWNPGAGEWYYRRVLAEFDRLNGERFDTQI